MEYPGKTPGEYKTLKRQRKIIIFLYHLIMDTVYLSALILFLNQVGALLYLHVYINTYIIPYHAYRGLSLTKGN